MSKKPKRVEAPKVSMDEFLAPIRAWRKEVGEERWEQYKREEQGKIIQSWIDGKRQFDKFEASDEGKAREEMRVGLELLLANEVIAKSPVCIEVLTAFHHCINYRWGAADAAGMIDVLAPHFDKVRAETGGKVRAAKTAEKDAPYRELLRQHPGSKPSTQRELITKQFGLNSTEAFDVVRRWRESEEGKKSPDASNRKSTTAKTAQKGAAQP